MKTIPTKENLGLPWGKNPEGDDWNLLDNQRMTIGISFFEMPLDFAIHAANTYHERRDLLMKCFDLLNKLQGTGPISRMDVNETVNRLRETLTPPPAT